MKFNVKLRKEDKRSLIILGVFLLAVGYYYLIFNPVYRKWENVREKLKKVEKEVQKERLKLGLARKIKIRKKEAEKKVGILKGLINEKLFKGSIGNRVEVIAKEAIEAGVKLTNLRPIKRSNPENGTSYYEFVIEGEGSFSGFINFLKNLKGLYIKELNFSRTRGKGLHFFLKASSLPEEAEKFLHGVKTIAVKKRKKEVGWFKPAVKLQPEPKKIKTEQKVQMVNKPPVVKKETPLPFKLVGISSINNIKMAVITDIKKGEDRFVEEGDQIEGYKVVEIGKRQVVFVDSLGNKRILSFPKEKGEEIQLYQETNQKKKTRKKKKFRRVKLGISVRVLDAELAKSKKIPFSTGLLVTKVKNNTQIYPGDVIVEINGIKVFSISQVKKIISSFHPGQEVNFLVWRNGRKEKIKVKIKGE